MKLVTVFRTFNPAEAELVRSRLDAAGFDTNLKHDLAALSMDGYALGVGGILVEVPEDKAEEAKALLASTEN
jgi:hypothetical protein